jgi:hypothetical protein
VVGLSDFCHVLPTIAAVSDGLSFGVSRALDRKRRVDYVS